MIDNPRSPRVRAAAKLAKKSARQKTGRFLVEGPQAIREAVRFFPELLEQVYLTPETLLRMQPLVEELKAAQLDLVEVSDKVLEVLADTVTPQGMVAVAKQFDTELTAGLSKNWRLVVVLDKVRDPGNAGTVIRVADAAGADAVILTESSVDLYNPKLVRSTTGSLFHLPVISPAPLTETLQQLKSLGLQVIAADIKGRDMVELRNDGVLNNPTAWLFGNEAHGLEDEHLALADHPLRVPIYGKAESLNLSTAAAICIYESAFAQRS